ncbi:MAG: glycoside hydrolase family 2 TIM barrel-domain containing protein [Nakamurella sp.]
MTYVSTVSPGWGTRRDPRSALTTDAPTISLDGEWRFRLLAGAPGTPGAGSVLPDGETAESVAEPELDDSAWDQIPVPAHWVLIGDGAYGRPIYTNVQFPFPIDPPHVPDENPTGDYRRTFDLPASWADAESVVLRFGGVESRYRLWLNGTEIGVGTGSRLVQEFDVTGASRTGTNTIAVRVHQWSADSYIEDQDQWWLPGIFRTVSLHARPVGGLDDVWLRADFMADGTGRVDPEICAAAAAFPVTLRVPGLGVEVRWASPADVTPLAVGDVSPWTAETPHLYDATVSSSGETVALRIGFRSINIVGDQLLVNGRKVVFHGVNRHEIDADRGRVFDADAARADLAMMKQFNINAIRTSHYPPTPQLLDIADELGLWVMVECDIETHGFEKDNWVGNPSDDPAWREVYLDRMQRTVEVHKNHPSVILWSLGNEAGTGQNLAAMAAWVHERDPRRPVHYEGDRAGAYTDVYSRMYATVAESTSIGDDAARTPLLDCSVPESARQRTKPFLWCEYAHAMGNGPGALDQYDDLIWRYPRLHGGFVWEWREHGLRTHTADGVEFFAYGGDFDEVVHDGNFVMDGLILPDSTPTSGLWEYKQVSSPVRLEISRGPGDFPAGASVATDMPLLLTVTNRRHTADTADLDLRWQVERDGNLLNSGAVPIDPIAAGQRRTIALPDEIDAGLASGSEGDAGRDSSEVWLTVGVILREATSWAPAGHSIGFAQHLMYDGTPGPGSDRESLAGPGVGRQSSYLAVSVVGQEESARHALQGASRVALGPAEFVNGRLTQLAGRPVSGPRLELFRGPTDNDRRASFGSYERADPSAGDGRGEPAPPYADVWRSAGLDRLTARVIEVQSAPEGVSVRERWSAANERASVDMLQVWRLVAGEVRLQIQILPSAGWDMVWPRIGVRFDLPASVDGASWFGTGPGESYPDSRRAVRVGRFAASLAELTEPYSRPQETGHRSALRSLTINADASPWLQIDAAADTSGRRPGFTLTPYTAQQLDRATHQHELVHTDHTYLYVDAAQCGLGSRACGPDVWPDFLLRPEARTLTLRVSAAERAV